MALTKPYYVMILILIIFIFLWFFFGGGEYEFVGLKPLDTNKIHNDIDNATTVYDKNKRNLNKSDDKIIGDKIVGDDRNICVDYTPNLPIEFTEKVCPNITGKFESKGEKICRQTMEKIYGLPFKNMRPKWLKNPETNRNLELDCYNEKLKLAVEYNGQQHYKYPSGFSGQTYEDFLNQQKRDKLKKEICEQNGVYLIVVPYNVPHDMIPTFIVYNLPEIVKKRLQEDDDIIYDF